MSFGPAQGYQATSLLIGDLIAGGVANGVLYEDASQNLKAEAAFTYDESTNILTVDTINAGDGTVGAPAYSFSSTGNSDNGLYLRTSNAPSISAAGAIAASWESSGAFIWNRPIQLVDSAGSNAAILSREAAAILQMGSDVNGAAVAQTFKAHDGITGTDVAGANLTLAGGRGTGSGAPGQLILSVATELATGTTAQTLAAMLTLSGGNNASAVSHLVYTAPTADLAMTASTEVVGASFGGTATYTREWATGALTLQRELTIQAPTYAFVGASTLTDAVTLNVTGAPIAGANATLTRTWTATFGVLEAVSTWSAPSSAVGIFAAGVSQLIMRDTTNNIEAHLLAGSDNGYVGTTTAHPLVLETSGAARLTISATGTAWTIATATSITFPDACNLVFNTTTGTKIGTATTQKLGFYNATPIVQGASVADASGGAVIDAEARTAINALISRIESLGLIATV